MCGRRKASHFVLSPNSTTVYACPNLWRDAAHRIIHADHLGIYGDPVRQILRRELR